MSLRNFASCSVRREAKKKKAKLFLQLVLAQRADITGNHETGPVVRMPPFRVSPNKGQLRLPQCASNRAALSYESLVKGNHEFRRAVGFYGPQRTDHGSRAAYKERGCQPANTDSIFRIADRGITGRKDDYGVRQQFMSYD